MTNPINAATQKAYHGTNKETLTSTATALGFTSEEWATLRQWNGLNRSVAKDEKGTEITFYETLETAAGTTYRSPVSAFVYNRNQLKRAMPATDRNN